MSNDYNITTKKNNVLSVIMRDVILTAAETLLVNQMEMSPRSKLKEVISYALKKQVSPNFREKRLNPSLRPQSSQSLFVIFRNIDKFKPNRKLEQMKGIEFKAIKFLCLHSI